MLLEFTVENYRSIKEPVTLSAVAQKSRKTKAGKKGDRKSDEEICPGFEVEGWDLKLLPVIAIFGANASGKSNVLEALDYLLCLTSNTLAYYQTNPYLSSRFKPSSFNLDPEYISRPTVFNIRVVFGNRIYEYHIEIRINHILKESLYYSTSLKKRSKLLFQRTWNPDEDNYQWRNGNDFSGAHTHLEALVRDDELFLTILQRFNIDIINPLNAWFKLKFIDTSSAPVHLENSFGYSFLKTVKQLDLIEKVIAILRKFDTGILDIELRERLSDHESGIYAIHADSLGSKVIWKFEEESLGTQRLFSLTCQVIGALSTGNLISVDELGPNLHPKIISYIIQLFQNPKTNPKGAQLIFTSHDNTLQRNQLLRRDEIWFTEKKPDQSTDLYSLADFKVRNDLAIDKAYLDGRFGAVPFLPETVEELLGVD
jgi:uncharacterized protein